MKKGVKKARIDEARRSLAEGRSIEDALAMYAPEAIGVRDVLGAGRRIHQAIDGAGPVLQHLLEDREVTDILVNGKGNVWVDRGAGLVRDEEASLGLSTEAEVRALAVRLSAACRQRLDDSCPIVDGTFESGLRLHAVLPPLSAEGTLLSLRAHRAIAYTLEDLMRSGTFARHTHSLIRTLVKKRANVMISGATGSGKTTLLASILGEVPPNERILIIEESAELRPVHPHVVHLQVRRANIQGRGEIEMSELVRAAMRMRPDRIILGECRGAEVREVLSALNTGHEGGWATIHANSATDVPARLVALGALAGMSESAVAAQAASALDAIIHVERGERDAESPRSPYLSGVEENSLRSRPYAARGPCTGRDGRSSPQGLGGRSEAAGFLGCGCAAKRAGAGETWREFPEGRGRWDARFRGRNEASIRRDAGASVDPHPHQGGY